MVNTTRSTLNMSARSEKDKKPRSLAWLLLAIAFVTEFLAFCLSFMAFIAPFWYVELNTLYRTGLWGRCDDPDYVCIWFFENDYGWEKSIPKWHIGAQVLYSIGIGLLFMSLMTSIGQLIFRCCKTIHTLPIIIGCVILIAMFFQMISIIVFGIGAYRTFEVSINSWIGHFEWAFYVGISALFVVTAAGLIFIYAGTKLVKEMKGYGVPYGMS